MIIQNTVSSSAPSGSVAGGASGAVPASGAGAPRVTAEQSSLVKANAKSSQNANANDSANSNLNSRPTAANLQNAVDTINRSFQQSNTSMQFTIDPNTKADVVQVTDTNTGEVISQYPSKVTLAISEAIGQEMKRGALLNQKA